MGNGNFRQLAKRKPLNRSKQMFVELIKSIGPPNRSKFIMIGGVAAPHTGEVVD
jgi:hypothetical protein